MNPNFFFIEKFQVHVAVANIIRMSEMSLLIRSV
jgi:hypothetical protein